MSKVFSDVEISNLLLQQESLGELLLKVMDAKVAAETAQYVYEAAVRGAGGHLTPDQVAVLKLFIDKEFKKSISAEFGDYQINNPVQGYYTKLEPYESTSGDFRQRTWVYIEFPSIDICVVIGPSTITIDTVHGVSVTMHYREGNFLTRPEEYLTQYMRTVKSLANP